jgi:hypothetical protein
LLRALRPKAMLRSATLIAWHITRS